MEDDGVSVDENGVLSVGRVVEAGAAGVVEVEAETLVEKREARLRMMTTGWYWVDEGRVGCNGVLVVGSSAWTVGRRGGCLGWVYRYEGSGRASRSRRWGSNHSETLGATARTISRNGRLKSVQCFLFD